MWQVLRRGSDVAGRRDQGFVFGREVPLSHLGKRVLELSGSLGRPEGEGEGDGEGEGEAVWVEEARGAGPWLE